MTVQIIPEVYELSLIAQMWSPSTLKISIRYKSGSYIPRLVNCVSDNVSMCVSTHTEADYNTEHTCGMVVRYLISEHPSVFLV